MRRWLSVLLLVALVVTVACGDDDDDGDTGDTGGAATATTADATGGATAATGGGDTGEGDPEAGRAIYEADCATCHSIDGSTVVGPTWQGLYGSEVELENGETVTADDEYIRESIREPGAKIHEGFPPAMPAFPNFTDQQINDIIAFIRTLE